ncbi:MAG: hypothetical protein ABI878_13530 [Acidobacteriota bacterium]
MLIPVKPFIINVILLAIVFGSLVGCSFGQSAERDKEPLIEIFTSGKGLVLQTDKPILFFRLKSDGSLEYDSRSLHKASRKSGHISDKDLKTLKAILETSDFETLRTFYDSIESLKDSVFVVQLAIMQKGSTKQISIKNYMPDHPNAGSYYPPVLVKLLDEIQRIRPMSSFEKKNNLVLNMPI